MIELDMLHGYALEALEALSKGEVKTVETHLNRIIGASDVLIDQSVRWDRARELYSDGFKPAAISARLGLSARSITDRAHKQNWPCSRKIAKQIKKKPTQDFIKQCAKCDSDFTAKSGKELICNVCRAHGQMAAQAKHG